VIGLSRLPDRRFQAVPPGQLHPMRQRLRRLPCPDKSRAAIQPLVLGPGSLIIGEEGHLGKARIKA